ncbi:MAG: hypothetical protein NVS2B14_19960 [Chamaesiphon sp.]
MNPNDSKLISITKLENLSLELLTEMESLKKTLMLLNSALGELQEKIEEAELRQLQAEFHQIVQLRQLETEVGETVAKWYLN